MPSATLTGMYGEPLEYLKGLLEASPAFASFSPTGSIYLIERMGVSGYEPAAGDGWAVVGYEQGDHRIRRTPGFNIERSPRLTLVKCVTKATEAVKADTINAIGDIVQDLNEAADADLVSDIDLVSFGIEDEADPPLIGAVLKVRMNL